MGFQVQLYIYDLSAGLARQIVPMLGLDLGFDVEGIWHTAIVFHQVEWFYGSGGIENCSPGCTFLGQPLKIVHLGETSMNKDSFVHYLRQIGKSRFKGDQYDLFKHNCNTFSNEIAQFLCNKSIPDYILQLPDKFFNSPLGRMVKPFIEQALPHGEHLPEDNVTTKETTTTFKHEQSVKYIGFTSRLTKEKVLPKLHEFNAIEDDKLSDQQLNTIAKLLDKEGTNMNEQVWCETFQPLFSTWSLERLYPFVDVLRWCSIQQPLPLSAIRYFLNTGLQNRRMLDLDGQEQLVRVTLRLLSNMFLHDSSRREILKKYDLCLSMCAKLVDSFSKSHDIIEIGVATLQYNFSATMTEKNLDKNQELAFQLLTNLSTVFLTRLKNYEAVFLSLSTIEILICADAETKDLALALELPDLLKKMPAFDKRVETRLSKCMDLLK